MRSLSICSHRDSAVKQMWLERSGAQRPRDAAIVIGAEFGVSWTAALAQLTNLELIDEHRRAALEPQLPTRMDYLTLGVTIRSEPAAPLISKTFQKAAIKAYQSNQISAVRALELLRGTWIAVDLPPPHDVPLDGMRDVLSLDD